MLQSQEEEGNMEGGQNVVQNQVSCDHKEQTLIFCSDSLSFYDVDEGTGGYFK